MMFMLAAGLAHADAPDNWKFTLDGYYRTRGYVFADLYEGQAKPGTLLMSRLRLQPQLNFEDRAKFFVTVDALDGAVWGDNASLASTALFAGDPSVTGFTGSAVDPVKVRRAWMEFKVPVGLLRVGRQGSNWGMGLLANEGNGFDDGFGENNFGSTYDRAIFATKPVSIAQTILGKKGAKEVPLVVAVGVDRLVEDPLIQYYGYSCDADDYPDGDPRCAEYEDHGSTDERDTSQRSDTWWVDTQDDVWEMIYVLVYRGEGVQLGKKTVGDITAGVYAVNRIQQETDSNVLIIDGYVKAEVLGGYFEGEILHIGGETRAITLASASDTDPYYKNADIWGYVVRGGYQDETLTAFLEHGYASGDDDPTDDHFTGRPLHPDYNVGLLLYEEILARTTAYAWGPDAQGLWSNGGVYNSRYLFPNIRYRPLPPWELSAAFLIAFPDKPDGSRVLCADYDEVECVSTPASAKTLGWEIDAAVKHKFHDHINFTLESAFAHATDRLPLKAAGLGYTVNKDGAEVGNYFTIQSRIAYEF